MKNDDFPKRKHPRYKSYDYSSNGCYFVTVCVKDREPLLSRIVSVGRDAYIPPKIRLSHIGEVLDGYIKNINTVYDGISVDNYVIMPDHFHLLLSFSFRETDGGMRASRPTLNSVIRSLKTMVTKKSDTQFGRIHFMTRS